jgi:outer membrane protein OmpA-like peptidoglycan-associated protein
MWKLAFVLGSLLGASVAVADNAPIGPDFVGSAPRLHIDRSLVASSSMNRIEPLDVVAFDHDSPYLSGERVSQVDRAAQWLLRHRGHRIVLEGHTDLAGMSPYNVGLATRRMNAVRQRLLGWGVSSDRIVMLTYGEEQAGIPYNPEDRRVVMFTTQAPVRDVVNAQLAYRHALVATWTDRGQQVQQMSDLGRSVLSPTATATARR